MKKEFPIRRLSPDASEFPPLLKEISNSPRELFVRGTLPPPGMPLVAVVGTRACTPYGRQVTEEIARGLAAEGVGIVSGLALGVDGLAHAAALDVGGYTIAVLGTGIDDQTIYPYEHQPLARRILEGGGALISEYPPKDKATGYSFQARNRIIAGLAIATLVTEAPQKSGALITAKNATDNNRELFVVPHPITSEKGAGNNGYLRLGARAVTSHHDILLDLNLGATAPTLKKTAPTDPAQKKIFELLGRQPLSINDIIKQSALPSASALSILTLLEIGGYIKNIGGMQFIRT